MLSNRILHYACRMPNCWTQTGNTTEGLVDLKYLKLKSWTWLIQTRTVPEEKNLIIALTCYGPTSNPMCMYSHRVIPQKWNMQWDVSPYGTIIQTTHHICKKKFRLHGLAPWEWTQSIRAARDILVAADSAPGFNTTRHVAYCLPITVSPFLLALTVFYFKWILCCYGQLWPYIGMGSLDTPLHRDFNAKGDTVKISPCVPSTCVQNAILSLLIIHIIPSRQIYVAIDNPTLVPSVSCVITGSYLWIYVCAADYVWPAENLKSNCCQCYLTGTNFETKSKLPKVSGIVVSTQATQYSTQAPSSFRSFILNSHCSFHWDDHSAHNNISQGVALPTRSCTVNPLSTRSGFLCICKSEIHIHFLCSQLEPQYNGKYRAQLCAVVHPIYTFHYDFYSWWSPVCFCILLCGALRLA